MKNFINMPIPSLIKVRNLIFLLTLFVFSSCQNQEALNWVIGLQAGQLEAPAPVGTVNFEFDISDINTAYDPSFLYDALQNNKNIDLYTIFLDVTDPAAGSLTQIREMSGDMVGRVIFRVKNTVSGSNSISFNVNSETNEIGFQMIYESNTYTGYMIFTDVQKINRTLYVKSSMSSGSFIADTDGDEIPDALDNCPAVANPDQADADSDAIGDVCDVCYGNNASGDADGDGYCASNDFDDNDANKYPGAPCDDGDACTSGDVYDSNGSCIPGPPLNCDDGDPNTIDYCDQINGGCAHTPILPDGDGDGIPDASDNCPTVANTDQADADSDGIGDVCDSCPLDASNVDNDGDGYCAAQDFDDNNANKYPGAPCDDGNACTIGEVYDANGNCIPGLFADDGTPCGSGLCNGAGVCVEPDMDGDGIPDATDNCPSTANADQADADGDGVGDVCDCGPGYISELSGGAVICIDINECTDGTSNCGPGTTCENTDGSFICVPIDTDGDGIGDNSDNCPSDANADQADADSDGIGDVCDICIGIDGTGDADGDGYCASVDCDDTNASINPGAVDIAGSGIDSNCDGSYLWYVDADGDGYGSSATVSSTNASPGAGESATADDCDDLVATTNPAGIDVAGSGIDSNCDGNYLWYVDADGDTYGSMVTASSTNASPGVGESATSDDCDDTNALINPGAVDVAGSGIDANCDGIFDKVDQTISFDQTVNHTLGDNSFALNATSSSGLDVVFSTSSDKVQINSSLVTIVSAGRVSIAANQPGNDSYNPADEVAQSFCINPEKPIISIGGRNTASPTLTSSSAAGNQWFLNGSAIAGETGQSLGITGQGQYAVQVSADDCVSELSEIKVFIITGDGNSADDTGEMLVYPNPVRDRLFISLQGFSKTGTLEMGIYDLSGRLIMNKQVRAGDIEEADVKHYAAGKYLIRIAQGRKIVNRQFIKE
ncbi:MAG: thrombospondin type 3 repeat-containing protein [Cyclobacteriaceae bacterium]|nr:thrombospondin type 3 repeat-containing protein [Cyclobacteriaceae bacterium]